MSAHLLDAALEGDPRSIARILTQIEDVSEAGRSLYSALFRLGGSAATLGVTGAPGSGKSTLVSGLVSHLAEAGKVAVVAVDPSSPFTGGAILGDRIRMGEHAGDPRVFIRSVANRGSLGGISESTPAIIDALDGLGFPEVVIETVGVGQSEVEIASTADTTVVVVSPGWGDAVQASKAGLLEIADVLVVNKADQPGADATVRDLTTMLSIGPERAWTPPVLEAVARDSVGIAEVSAAVMEHREYLSSSGEGERRRRRRATHDLAAAIRQAAARSADGTTDRSALIDEIADRSIDPWEAAMQVLG